MRLYEFVSNYQVVYGASGPQVRDIQKQLETIGYSVGPPGIDGRYGPYTAAAIGAFKRDYRLGSNSQYMIDQDIKTLGDVVSGAIPRASSPTKPDFSSIKPSGESGGIGSWLGGIGRGISSLFGGKTGGGPANLTWASSVDQDVRPELLSKLSQLQVQFGRPFTIISGRRSSQRNKDVGGASRSRHLSGEAVDIKWPSTEEDTVRLIALASALGFGGIGVYGPGSVHLDIRPERMGWGSGYRRGSWPSWADSVMRSHMSGSSSGFGFGNFGAE